MIRYGRPAAAPKLTGEAPTQRQPAAKAAGPKKVRSPKPPAAPKPPRELGKKAGQTTVKVAGALGSGLTGARHKVGDTVHAGLTRARSFRLPRLEQTRAAAIVGAIVGLTTVALTGLLTRMFSELRGVSTGGGRWGSLTIVVVAFVAFALGELLLAKMHVRQPRVTSFLGLVITLVVIMGLLLGVINSVWAWLIMPVLGAAAFALSHRLIAVTDSTPRHV